MNYRKMKMIGTVLIAGVLCFVLTASLAFAYNPEWEKYFPRADRKMSPVLMERWNIPSGYQFPNDWVKTVDWGEISRKFKGTTVTMAIQGHDVSAPEMFKKDFEALSGIKVKLFGVPSEEYTEKLLVEFLAGTAKYDTIEYYQGDTNMYLPYLEDLAPFVQKYNYKDIRDIHPVYFWIQSLRDNKIVSLPFDSDCRSFHYRPKMLALAGYDRPPKTWEEVLEYGKKLQQVLPAGVYPFGTTASRAFGALKAWMAVGGPEGTVLFEDGWKVAVNSPEGVKAMETLVELAKYAPPGVAGWGYSESREAWLSGRLAMIEQWECIGRQMYDPDISEIALETPRPETAPTPQGTGPKAREAYPVVQGSSAGLCVASENKDAAAIWLFFLNGVETQFTYSISGTGVETGHRTVMANPVYQRGFPPAKVWLYQLDYANTEQLWIPEWSALEETGTMIVNSGFVGDYTPKKTMDVLAARWTKIMEKAGFYRPGAPSFASSYWPDVRDEVMPRIKALYDRLLK